MYIFKTVTECDFADEKFASPVEGIACIAQGATGRWCEVMWGGPKILQQLLDDGTEILTVEEARETIEQSGNGYPDF